ncbi:MAG: hypothetical protein IPI93_15425 [Sphingobacteriaceae bacterium]|nr:hypothetical protein [Sphingobacteriaceae bacterium]MBK7816834.1 hypothetical protein [Sphingobacteriaceae bacterium]
MFSKIELPAATIRFLTLACYFLPFVFYFSTCVDGVTKSAFNKADAIKHEKEKVLVEKQNIFQTAANEVIDHLTFKDTATSFTSETMLILENLGDNWYLYPTFTSISAIGVAFILENPFAKIVISLSALFSLVTFLLWRFLDRKKIAVYVIGSNLFFVLVFFVTCLVINATLLYGAYALLFLLLIQLFSEIQKRKKINSNFEVISPN